MKRPIFWLPEAIKTYHENITFLRGRWYEKIVQNFKNQVEKYLNFISENPQLFRTHDKKLGIYKCLIVKQITLYYKVSDEKIELLTFWNNYQNPERLKIY